MLAGGRFGTRNLARARAFYDAIAEIIGARVIMERPNLAVYKAGDGGAFVIGTPLIGEALPGNGNQLTLVGETRAMVDAVHAKVIELGGTCEGAPGIRGREEDGFYAAYFRDLDDNKWVIYRSGPE